MMKKTITILVPTDFSPASRAGIRFAVQWARQQKAKLLLTHVMGVVRMTRWSPQQFESFAAAQRRLAMAQLRRLAADVCRQMHFSRKGISTLLIEGMSADVSLQDFCRSRPDIGLICMGTRGAGRIRKILGTHTGNLILHSDVPVVAVPAAYRIKPIRNILYATDLVTEESELQYAVMIARDLKASLSVMHIAWVGETRLDPAFMAKVWSQKYAYPVSMRYEAAEPSLSVAGNLNAVIRRRKPSLVIMFSDRERTGFDRLFFPSQAEGLSFRTNAPLMVIGKGTF
jgi:nucleotide-binding universal stress UspA family protein